MTEVEYLVSFVCRNYGENHFYTESITISLDENRIHASIAKLILEKIRKRYSIYQSVSLINFWII